MSSAREKIVVFMITGAVSACTRTCNLNYEVY